MLNVIIELVQYNSLKKFVRCYSNNAASITYELKMIIYSNLFCPLQFFSLLSTLDQALTSCVSLVGTLIAWQWQRYRRGGRGGGGRLS